jgi:hypothetical protein
VARTLNFDEALDALETRLQWQVATEAHNRVVVHAGVVAWRGRAIILPGYSFGGKSTLVAELLRRGATYYSDEYALLDARGHVHPYARRLSLRPVGDTPGRRCTAADLGAATGTGPLPVSQVALTKYRPQARWQPRRLSAGQAVWELMNCTLTAQARPDAALNVLQQLAGGAACWKGVRGEAAETAARLLEQADAIAQTVSSARLAA